jgi:hypothetical protein
MADGASHHESLRAPKDSNFIRRGAASTESCRSPEVRRSRLVRRSRHERGDDSRATAGECRRMIPEVSSLRPLLVLFPVLLACPSLAVGTCPVPQPPCAAMQKADLVFYGEVLSAAPPQHGSQRVAFLVARPFKGVQEGRFTAAFRTSADGLYFVAGQRRVIYASSLGGGRWSTACARSAVVLRPADQEVADLTRCGAKPR